MKETAVGAAGVRTGGRSARVVAAVLEATRSELNRVGYGALSVERVADLAGVAKTTVYRRWPQKAELVRDALLARIEARTMMPADAGSLELELTELAQHAHEGMQQPEGQCTVRMLYSEGNNPEVQSLVRVLRKAKLRVPFELFQRAAARGEIASAEMAELAWQMVVGSLHYRTYLLGERLSKAELRALVAAVLHGVCTSARRGRTKSPAGGGHVALSRRSVRS